LLCCAEKNRKSFRELSTHYLIMQRKINKNVKKFSQHFCSDFKTECLKDIFSFESFLFYFSMTSSVHLFRLFLLHNLNKIQIFLLILSFGCHITKERWFSFIIFGTEWKQMAKGNSRWWQITFRCVSFPFASLFFFIPLKIFPMLIFEVV
jgi:hypothetical protein